MLSNVLMHESNLDALNLRQGMPPFDGENPEPTFQRVLSYFRSNLMHLFPGQSKYMTMETVGIA